MCLNKFDILSGNYRKRGKQFNKKKKKKMKVFCLAGLARSSLLHTACLTCNIFSDFSYTHAFIQLLENGQVDSAETAEIAESPQISFPSRINHLQPTIISIHGNKPYFDINLHI